MSEAVTPAAPAPAAAPSSGGSPAPSPSGGSAPSQSGGAPTPPPRGADGAPPAPPSRIKWKDTIDGKEVELEATEEELRAHYRKARAADQRFDAAAKMRKQAEQAMAAQKQLLADIQRNPAKMLAWLQEQGVDNALDVVANALQAKLAEEEQLQDPTARRAHEAERKLAELRQQQEQQEIEQRTAAFEAQVTQETDRIVQVFDKALELLDLPADDDTLAVMAALESENRRRGLNLSPERLAQEVQDRVLKRGVKTLLSGLKSQRLSHSKLLNLDPELTKAFRLALFEEHKAKKAGGVAPKPPVQQSAPPPQQSQRRLTEKEEWERLEQEKGRRLLRTI